MICVVFFSSRRRHTRCALVTGVQTCALPISAIVRAFPWPKSQRWGAASISTESLRWVRPLSGVFAILGEDLVECEVGGIASGYVTKGQIGRESCRERVCQYV